MPYGNNSAGRQAQILSRFLVGLEILNVFLRLKFFTFLDLNKKS